MLSVSQFAKRSRVSSRTIRYYESIGLLPKSRRGENNYRYYDDRLLAQVERIRELQELGFSLEEIAEVLNFSNAELRERLEVRLSEVRDELGTLEGRRERIEKLLSVTLKLQTGVTVTETERTLYMEAVREAIKRVIEKKYSRFTEAESGRLLRDRWLEIYPHMKEFVRALQSCLEFARSQGLTLGPGRGSSASSITLFGLGLSTVDPMRYDLIPERLWAQAPNIHLDVEFERGQPFVDHCREVTRGLVSGQIHAFKLPILDIINKTHERVGAIVPYDEIDENSDAVLDPVREGRVEKIFNFDYSPNALAMKHYGFLPGYTGTEKMKAYLASQKIHNFRDVINITALWRPELPEHVERMNGYLRAKENPRGYDFLAEELRKHLEPNFGMIIYHEDLVRIIHHYSHWDLARCNSLRISGMRRSLEKNSDWEDFRKLAPPPVAKLVFEESPWSFCQPHAIAFAQLTKRTALLKSLHEQAYLQEIHDFEQKHGFTWDDFGFRTKGMSLMQD